MVHEQMLKTPDSIRNKPEVPRIIIEVFGNYDDFYKKVKEYYDASKQGGYETGAPSFYRQIIGAVKLSREDWNRCVREIIIVVERLKKREEYKKQRLIKDAALLEEQEEKRRTGLPKDFIEL